jgi:hypothetical protein
MYMIRHLAALHGLEQAGGNPRGASRPTTPAVRIG